MLFGRMLRIVQVKIGDEWAPVPGENYAAGALFVDVIEAKDLTQVHKRKPLFLLHTYTLPLLSLSLSGWRNMCSVASGERETRDLGDQRFLLGSHPRILHVLTKQQVPRTRHIG